MLPTRMKRTAFAKWAMRIALFSAQLIVLALLLHRFTPFPTPVALNLVLVGFAGAFLALILAIVAVVRIWQFGMPGFGHACAGAFVAIAILMWPAVLVPRAMRLPAINDVTTDAARPPTFVALARARPTDANSASYPGTSFALEQAAAYPDIKPLEVARPSGESFDITRSVVARLGWRIVSESPPSKSAQTGLIEAVDETLILGFDDDVVIRVVGDQKVSRIDVRSASRYGRHDLGRNAERVRGLLKQLHARLSLAAPAEEVDETSKSARPQKVKRTKKKRSKKASRSRAQARARSKAQGARRRKVQRRAKRRRRRRDIQSQVFQRR